MTCRLSVLWVGRGGCSGLPGGAPVFQKDAVEYVFPGKVWGDGTSAPSLCLSYIWILERFGYFLFEKVVYA